MSRHGTSLALMLVSLVAVASGYAQSQTLVLGPDYSVAFQGLAGTESLTRHSVGATAEYSLSDASGFGLAVSYRYALPLFAQSAESSTPYFSYRVHGEQGVALGVTSRLPVFADAQLTARLSVRLNGESFQENPSSAETTWFLMGLRWSVEPAMGLGWSF